MTFRDALFLGPDFPLPIDRPFRTASARAAGIADKALSRLVAAGYLRRLLPGVLVAAHVPDSIDLRRRAVALVVPPDCFVCDRTAAWMHAGPKALAPNENLAVPPVSCFRPSDGGRLRNGLTVSGERNVLPRDLMEIDGVKVTTPLRTALDLGRLERTHDMRMWGIDCMLGTGTFMREELHAEIPRFKGERGVVGLRVLAPWADPGTESFGEAALKLRWMGAGLPRPQTQIPVWLDGRAVCKLDLGLEELLFAAEFDGEEWHGEERREYDDDRRAWLRDDRRWSVEVFRKEHVWGHHQDAERRLQGAFRRARATLGERTFVV